MAKAKRKASATTKRRFHHFCSIEVRSGEQEYMIYELKVTDTRLSEQDYYREVLEFCGYMGNAVDERLEGIAASGRFEEWPYDDRLYIDPWVQDISEAEYDVLRKYLHCR